MTYNFLTDLVKEKGITKNILEYKILFEYQELIKTNNYNWTEITKLKKFDKKFINLYWNNIDFTVNLEYFCKEYQFNEDQQYQTLSESLIRDFQDKDCMHISRHQILSEDFIREFQNKRTSKTRSYANFVSKLPRQKNIFSSNIEELEKKVDEQNKILEKRIKKLERFLFE